MGYSCPHCGRATKVLDTRTYDGGGTVHRRRICEADRTHSFTTVEVDADYFRQALRKQLQDKETHAAPESTPAAASG